MVTHLTGHRELVTDLRLSRAELSVQFRNGSSFDSTCVSSCSIVSVLLTRCLEEGRQGSPPRMLSRAVQPVVIATMSERRAWLEQGSVRVKSFDRE